MAAIGKSFRNLYSPTPKSPSWLPLSEDKTNELLLQEASKELAEQQAKKRAKTFGKPFAERLREASE